MFLVLFLVFPRAGGRGQYSAASPPYPRGAIWCHSASRPSSPISPRVLLRVLPRPRSWPRPILVLVLLLDLVLFWSYPGFSKIKWFHRVPAELKMINLMMLHKFSIRHLKTWKSQTSRILSRHCFFFPKETSALWSLLWNRSFIIYVFEYHKLFLHRGSFCFFSFKLLWWEPIITVDVIFYLFCIVLICFVLICFVSQMNHCKVARCDSNPLFSSPRPPAEGKITRCAA